MSNDVLFVILGYCAFVVSLGGLWLVTFVAKKAVARQLRELDSPERKASDA